MPDALEQGSVPRQLLGRVPLLRGISGEDADQLAAALQRRECAKGEVIISQGDTGDELFIVEQGQLTVTIESAGRDVRVGRLGPNDVVGEMAVLRATPRSATVSAAMPCVVWSLSREHFAEALGRNEALARRFDEEMHRRDVANALRLLQ